MGLIALPDCHTRGVICPLAHPALARDKRITWHVGDLEDTIGEMEAEHIASGRRLAYFDLDLYDPSKVAWEWIRPHLRPGDILYFDEAFDADERRLLDESVLPAGSYDYIGATVMNLAIEVRSLR